MTYGSNPYPQQQPPFGQPYGNQPFPQQQPPFGAPQQQAPYQPPAPQGWGQNQPQQQWQPLPQAQLPQPQPSTPVPQPEPKKAVFVDPGMPISTTDTLPGMEITELVGPVFGAVLRARDARASQDLVGQLVSARQDALAELVAMASSQDATAVVGVHFETAKVSDQLAEVCCYGTAVHATSTEDVKAERAFDEASTTETLGTSDVIEAASDDLPPVGAPVMPDAPSVADASGPISSASEVPAFPQEVAPTTHSVVEAQPAAVAPNGEQNQGGSGFPPPNPYGIR